MRIVRYPLEIQQYQQVQPLWPGSILGVVASPPYDENGYERPLDDPRRYRIDLYCFDNDTNRGDRLPPILGVWIIGTGNPIPQAMFDADALYHGTVDFRPHGGAWHVFSAVVGLAESSEIEPVPQYGSVDEMAARIRARHARGES